MNIGQKLGSPLLSSACITAAVGQQQQRPARHSGPAGMAQRKQRPLRAVSEGHACSQEAAEAAAAASPEEGCARSRSGSTQTRCVAFCRPVAPYCPKKSGATPLLCTQICHLHTIAIFHCQVNTDGNTAPFRDVKNLRRQEDMACAPASSVCRESVFRCAVTHRHEGGCARHTWRTPMPRMLVRNATDSEAQAAGALHRDCHVRRGWRLLERPPPLHVQ